MDKGIHKIHVPERRCAACGRHDAKGALCRLVRLQGALSPDPKQRLSGRGAYLCPAQSCWVKASKRHGVERSLRLAAILPESDWSALAKAFGFSIPVNEARPGCRKERHGA